MNLAALRVKILLNPTSRRAKYPPFNTLPIVQASGLDWSQYVDHDGMGWIYDRIGHRDDTVQSPFGQQWGVLLIPAQFAIEAVAAFPAACQQLTEAQLQSFYDNDHAPNIQDEEIDLDILHKIALKQQLGVTLTTQQTNAINPAHPERGIRPNWRKTWAQFKTRRNITFVEPT